jgi:uncharacterized protein involved in type VI secretion and phage assembly
MIDQGMEKLVAEIIRKIDRRFFGKYRGVVIDNRDPENLGRLKVKVPSVLGNEIVSGWANPCVPFGGNPNTGNFFIPENGAGVWVEFEEGDLEFPVWVGTFWSKPDNRSEVPKPNNGEGAEVDEIPDPDKRKMIKTKMGHTIQLVDDENNGMVIVKDGVNGHVMVMDNQGIRITDGVNSGNKIEMKNGEVVIASTKVKIGEGANAEKMVLGMTSNNNLQTFITSLITYLATHIHTGNLGAPTSPPIVPPSLSCALGLSGTHVVE